MERAAPQVRRLTARAPAKTIFTRFIPATRVGKGVGTWRCYYERWPEMTILRLGRDKLKLIPELTEFTPPTLFSTREFNRWYATQLRAKLRSGEVAVLIVSASETDVCVLSTAWAQISTATCERSSTG
jgi:nicotinamidase-related amidase